MNLRDVQRVDEKFFDKTIGRPARELVRERHDEQRVDAHAAQDFFFLLQCEDLFRHAIGRDDGERMRMKRHDRRRHAKLARAIDHAADDRLMADVHPVEVADRGDAAGRQVGLFERVVED